jgi:hypothetical protein
VARASDISEGKMRYIVVDDVGVVMALMEFIETSTADLLC